MWSVITSAFLNLYHLTIGYFEGQSTTAIMNRKVELVLAGFYGSLFYAGLKPVFSILKNTLLFLKGLVLGLFNPQAKDNYLRKRQEQETIRLEKLKTKIQLKEQSLQKIEHQINKLKPKLKPSEKLSQTLKDGKKEDTNWHEKL